MVQSGTGYLTGLVNIFYQKCKQIALNQKTGTIFYRTVESGILFRTGQFFKEDDEKSEKKRERGGGEGQRTTGTGKMWTLQLDVERSAHEDLEYVWGHAREKQDRLGWKRGRKVGK